MKRINLLIGALLLTAAGLLYSALVSSAVPVRADDNLTCLSLTDCCGSAGCNSPGSVSDCKLTCAGGGNIDCPKKSPKGCGGGGDEIILE